MTALLAINWEPELRGVLIVIIAVVTLCGSIYLILGTNLGARLGFLVILTGLAGWLMLMGVIWAIYGIGLKGPEPSWEAIPGRTVLQDTDALYRAGVLEQRLDVPDDATFTEEASIAATQFEVEGWVPLPEEDPGFGQASASAAELLEETDTFAAGEFRAVNVFDTGGERYPMIGELRPARVLAPSRTTPSSRSPRSWRRAPSRAGRRPRPLIDENRQHQYVYMVRDLGARRHAGVRADRRGRPDLLRPVLVAAPTRAHRQDQPRRAAGPRRMSATP